MPEYADVWYSQRIEKMDIANGRNAETIRKHMKK
jgi:glutamine cyclotransferase